MKNGTMLQSFHWYTPGDGNFWNQLKDDAKKFQELGITACWIPPVGKCGAGVQSVGYDVYDLYDLGEFDQKNTIRIKYGTREELIAATHSLHESGIAVYVDVVMNHMGGADETEKILVRKTDPENRNRFTSEPFEIQAFTKFTFPGRKGKYSHFIWDHKCFSGIDYAADLKESGIFRIMNDEYGEGWEELIDDEKGNFDYLMFADIEFRNPAVREELKHWGKWLYDSLNYDGYRLDAVKHITPYFINEWLDSMREQIRQDLFAVAEYWAPGNLDIMLKYIEITDGRVHLFDARLQNNFHRASKEGKTFNLSCIFENTLVSVKPELTVSLVSNHDTQPLQSLEAPVEPWFKPLAYALILLRREGYPCIFYPDLYGAHYVDSGKDGENHEIFLEKVNKLEELIRARALNAYGEQKDYFDHSGCIGWTRAGDSEHSGLAVLLSNDQAGFKTMELGKRYAGKEFVDFLQNHPGKVRLDENGQGNFLVSASSVSVWVEPIPDIRS
jgi:alpha-amylase